MSDIAGIIPRLEHQKAAIDNAIAALRGIVGGAAPSVQTGPAIRKGGAAKQVRAISEGRQRQIEAMRRYWAQKRGAAKKTPAKTARKRVGMTRDARKRLSDLMKKRWAAKQAGRKR